MPESSANLPTHASRAASRRAALVVALVVFTVVYLANAWVSDDAFISFRVSDNIVHGYGPRWNVDERVQAFTNPLWTFLIAGVASLTGEYFYTSMAVSFVLGVAMLAIAWGWLGRTADGWLLLALLLTSKAFVDYASSGLENPLSHLLVTIFVVLVLGSRTVPDETVGGVGLRALVAVASVAFLNRADSLLVYLPVLAWELVRRLRTLRRRDVGWLVVAAAPAWGWLVFALIYYGFPFPNTYYAKVAIGVPQWVQVRQGLAYVVSSLRFDPVTLACVAAAAGVSLVVGGARRRLLAGGALLYVLFTVWVGGDFMAGRFFALPFVVAALLLADVPKRRSSAIAAVVLLIAVNVVNPLAPVKTIPHSSIGWSYRLQNGVKDERGALAPGVNPLFFETFRRMPDNPVSHEGRSFAASPERVLVHPWIGEIGFLAGPAKYIIDPNALSDPLLARLPVPPSIYFEFWASHWTRELPGGYVESRREGKNLVVDPAIHDYFDKILNVTTGPIFSRSRFRDIWDLNWGRDRAFHDRVKRSQRLHHTVRMDNPLWRTDAGRLDRQQRVLRSNGKAGYLLLGPGVPLRAGTYRIQWNGSVDRPGNASDGFAEVCYDDCRRLVAKVPIDRSTDGRLADTTVALHEDARDIEFRVFVHETARVTLNSVAIAQQ